MTIFYLRLTIDNCIVEILHYVQNDRRRAEAFLDISVFSAILLRYAKTYRNSGFDRVNW